MDVIWICNSEMWTDGCRQTLAQCSLFNETMFNMSQRINTHNLTWGTNTSIFPMSLMGHTQKGIPEGFDAWFPNTPGFSPPDSFIQCCIKNCASAQYARDNGNFSNKAADALNQVTP
jgi:hypothetical protein